MPDSSSLPKRIAAILQCLPKSLERYARLFRQGEKSLDPRAVLPSFKRSQAQSTWISRRMNRSWNSSHSDRFMLPDTAAAETPACRNSSAISSACHTEAQKTTVRLFWSHVHNEAVPLRHIDLALRTPDVIADAVERMHRTGTSSLSSTAVFRSRRWAAFSRNR